MATLQSLVNGVTLTPLPSIIFFRSVDLTVLVNLGVKLLDGTHAGVTGSRYNKPGGKPTCYLAGSQTLAAFECEQEAMVLGLTAVKRNPRITCAIEVSGAKVLDLTNNIVVASLGISATDLTDPTFTWRNLNLAGLLSTTQQIGEAACARPDCDGILCPSWLVRVLSPASIPRLENLVLFMDPAHPIRHRNGGVAVSVFDPTGLFV